MTSEAIKAVRDEFGWSQEKLARAIGVSWMTVWRWEAGHSVPRPAAVIALEQLAQQVAVRRAADARRSQSAGNVSAAALSGKE